jgi:hypothetical protein
MRLNLATVPTRLRSLVPLAEEWGEPDERNRERRVYSASSDELRALVDEVMSKAEDLDDWLAGDEAQSDSPTDEYVAFSALYMAAELAQAILENPRRAQRPDP